MPHITNFTHKDLIYYIIYKYFHTSNMAHFLLSALDRFERWKKYYFTN